MATQRLKQSVSGYQCAENFSELNIGQMIRIDNRAARDGNVHPVEIRHGAEHKQPEDQKPPDVRCLFRRHWQFPGADAMA